MLPSQSNRRANPDPQRLLIACAPFRCAVPVAGLAVASVLSMTVVGSFLVLAVWVLGNVDASGTTSACGGFSADGSRYLVGKEQVCEPLPARAASGQPRCERVADAKARKDLGFQKPKRQRRSADGKLRLVPEIDADRRLVVRGIPDEGDPVELVSWDAGAEIAVVKGLVPSADGGALAVELTLRTRPDAVEVVAFRLPGVPEKTPPPPERPAPGGDASARAMAGGGKWSQRLVACDTAGVELTLTKQRKFALTIQTKCRSERWTTKLDGTWVPEGADTLVLTFQNEGAADEKLACSFASCEGKDCLQCTLEELTFSLTPKR